MVTVALIVVLIARELLVGILSIVDLLEVRWILRLEAGLLLWLVFTDTGEHVRQEGGERALSRIIMSQL